MVNRNPGPRDGGNRILGRHGNSRHSICARLIVLAGCRDVVGARHSRREPNDRVMRSRAVVTDGTYVIDTIYDTYKCTVERLASLGRDRKLVALAGYQFNFEPVLIEVLVDVAVSRAADVKNRIGRAIAENIRVVVSAERIGTSIVVANANKVETACCSIVGNTIIVRAGGVRQGIAVCVVDIDVKIAVNARIGSRIRCAERIRFSGLQMDAIPVCITGPGRA